MSALQSQKKKPTTLAGWQKIYPSAIRFAAKGNSLLSSKEIVLMTFGQGKGKVVSDSSSATWSSKGGTKANINAIVCSMEDYLKVHPLKTE